MTDPAFVHLRLHTEFSLVDGLVRIKELVNVAKDQQIPAIAITDQVNLFALVKFFKATTGAGIKPIFGADIWIENDTDPEATPHRMTLLSMNEKGYRNLMELISLAYEKGQNIQPERALLQKRWIAERSEGLIALSGAKDGEIGRALADNDSARAVLEEWQTIFPGRCYNEIGRTSIRGRREKCGGGV